jgi:hypothetical protein
VSNPENQSPVLVDAQRISREDEQVTKVGDYLWYRLPVEDGAEGEVKWELAVVTEVRSNCVKVEWFDFYVYSDGSQSSTSTRSDTVGFEEIGTTLKREPDGVRILQGEMEQLKLEMADLVRQLRDTATANGAAVAVRAEIANVDQVVSSMLPTIRVTDPDLQKARLLAIKENTIPAMRRAVCNVTAQFSVKAKMLMHPEKAKMDTLMKELQCIDQQIFTIELYAGLREHVKQIRKGEPAAREEAIEIRQSMLYMDEETMFYYDAGGMDFANVEDFDKWVCRPEVLSRVLPSARGVVAWQIRRHKKDYGPASSLWVAFQQADWHMRNTQTYILIRNGDNVYRIISDIDFSPGLVPFRDEFDAPMKIRGKKLKPSVIAREAEDEAAGRRPSMFYSDSDYEYEFVTPDHHAYDIHVRNCADQMRHYNRIVVLIQGLLDRSDVFAPHEPISLMSHDDFNRCIRIVRDDEDVLTNNLEKWSDYQARLNALLKPGDIVTTKQCEDLRQRPGNASVPEYVRVRRVRAGRESDAFTYKGYRGLSHDFIESRSRSKRDVVGVPGVVVEWEKPSYERWSRRWCRYETVSPKGMHTEWFPLDDVLNVTAYVPKELKRFASDRRWKSNYAAWVKAVFSAERYYNSKDLIPHED